MRKTIHLLNIGGAYAPEITAMTYPLIDRYAQRIGADVSLITERKFPAWDLDYEKLQIYEVGRESDWNIYIDSDALIHPDTPDITELLHKDTVAHNGMDLAPIRWTYDDYMRRDGRHIGSCCWFMVCSNWCLDMVRPLDDLTYAEAVKNIRLTMEEERSGVLTPGHLITDYAVSRNIARFGLKFVALNNILQKSGEFFWHVYTVDAKEKFVEMRRRLKSWGV